jgi:hypothetical protein
MRSKYCTVLYSRRFCDCFVRSAEAFCFSASPQNTYYCTVHHQCIPHHQHNTSPVHYSTSTVLQSTSPVQCLTSTSPVRHQFAQYITTTSTVLHQYITGQSPIHLQHTASTSAVCAYLSTQFVASDSPVYRQYITSTSPALYCTAAIHHKYNTSPVQYITSTSPRHHQDITSTSPVQYITITSPVHCQSGTVQYITSTSPARRQYITSTSPVHHQYSTAQHSTVQYITSASHVLRITSRSPANGTQRTPSRRRPYFNCLEASCASRASSKHLGTFHTSTLRSPIPCSRNRFDASFFSRAPSNQHLILLYSSSMSYSTVLTVCVVQDR